ncbi:MAG: hypothetical protein Q9159_005094 [Coniocarpon cinnabarinum]
MAPTQSSVPDLAAIGFSKAPAEFTSPLKNTIGEVLQENCHRFPGAQPVSFARHHIKALKERDYFLCEKSDGVRCLLFMTQDDKNQEVQYFIDRKNDYYYVPQVRADNGMPGFHAPKAPDPRPDGKPGEIEWESFHTRTVLDGELLWDTYHNGDRILKYLVFDCLTLDGDDLTNRTLDKRLAYFMEKVYQPYVKLLETFPEDTTFLFRLEKKDFQLSYATEMMFNEIMPNLKHGCDGLIFTCRETPYRYGTDENILKWKPAEENTIDFRLSLQFPPVVQNGTNGAAGEDNGWDRDYNALPKFELWSHVGNNEYDYFADLHVEPQEWTTMKQYAIDHDDGLEGAVIECHKDGQGRWRFNRWREDKNEGNHVSVVDKVQQSIEDAVSRAQLIRETQEIRAAWKERAAAQKRMEQIQGAAKKA